MKKWKAVFILVVTFLAISGKAHAILIDVTSSAYPHFGDFINQSPNASDDFSHISDGEVLFHGDFGWHNSPSFRQPSLSGILLPEAHSVESLRLQVHNSPFRDFILQGSSDTTTGFNGAWNDLLNSTVTLRQEREWQEWQFDNDTPYSSYRIHVLNDYPTNPVADGWAMYRWELLADDGSASSVIPEPATTLLLGMGFTGMGFYRKKKRHL